jgi:RNA polymerase sigma factor
MTEHINQLAVCAAADDTVREDLILQQEQTILRTAAAVSHRYIGKSDDEWSVALCAFSRAIDLYSMEKGNFLPFAQMLIKRALIDLFRTRKSALHEVPVAPHILEGNGEPEEDPDGVYFAVVKTSAQASDNSMRDEITAANELLKTYGFRFYDLTECSPKQDKTREDCAKVVRYMLDQYPPELLEELKRRKKLPVKALANATGISKKTIDRYRKYMIMAILILEGDFPHIAEYLKFVREEASA